MSPAVVALFSALISLQNVDSLNLKPNQLVLERVTGPPPIKSRYVTEDSGSKVRRVSRNGPPGMNILFNFTKPAPNSTMLSLKVLERHDNAYRSQLGEYKVNLCEYLAIRKKPVVVFRDAMKFPRSCPLGPGVYKVENWQITEMLPPILPVTDGFQLISLIEFAKDDYILNNIYLKVGRN